MAEPILALIPSQLMVLDVTPIRALMEPIDIYLGGLEATTGLPIDKLKYLAAFLFCYPTAILHRFIPIPFIRHLYSMILGITIVIYMVGNEVYHSIFSAFIGYLILFLFRGSTTGTKLVWLWSFGYMTVSHIYRLYIDYMGWSVDFTVVQMVLTLKMCALACNIQDGHNMPADLSSYHKNASISKSQFPSLFNYFSYVFYWCTILPGPFFEYNEFMQFMDMSMFPNKTIPSGSLVAFLKIWGTLIFTFAGVFIGFNYPIWKVVEPSFNDFNFIEKTAYLVVSMTCVRCNYYTGWLMSEGAIILNGFGYRDGKWDRFTNIIIPKIELGSSFKQMIDNWNLGTARFLKYYVYFRVSAKPLKPGEQRNGKQQGYSPEVSQLIVFIVSAFWHGFYPGYYIFFVTMFFFQFMARKYERVFTARFYNEKGSPLNIPYTLICVICSVVVLDYSAIAFVTLSLENALIGYGTFYWSHHILIGISFILISVGILRPVRRESVVKVPEKSN